jgi:hypothetical protein
MRLSIALGALAGGLVLASAGLALADAPPPTAPPAAPIFYCPSAPGPQKAAPAAGPTAAPSCPPTAQPAPVARVAHRHERPRHEPRYAEGRPAPRAAPPREDVSASQAFIYRYERALHGFNAEAADAAWAHAGPPPCPRAGPEHCPMAEAPRPPPPPVIAPPPPPAPPERVYVQPAPPPPVIVEVEPTPPARVYVERIAPPAPPPPVYAPPPCPDRCPMSNDGWRDHHDYAAAPPVYEHRQYVEAPPAPVYSGRAQHYGYITPPAPPAPVYERHEEHYGYVNPAPGAYSGYAYERRETEQSSGWRYSDGDGGYAVRRGPCPPAPDHGCSAAADGGYGAVYQYSGRDAYGFLVWPGKSNGQ